MYPSTFRPAAEELILHLTKSPRFTRFIVGSALAHQFMVFQALTLQARGF